MKHKNILKSFLYIGILPIIAIPIAALAISQQSSSKISNFYNAFNDPYKELDMFSQSLQYGNKAKFSNMNNKNPISNVDFLSKSDQINNSMRDLVKNLANYINSLNTFKNKNITVLFVKNDQLYWDNSEKSKSEVNQFCIEQPILYSQIYSNLSNNDCPGFGMYFPTPINDDANSLFDDWFEIGAAQLDSAGSNKSTISQRLTSAFSSTADIVFYLYDSNQIGDDEEGFIRYVYNSCNDKFWPYRLLKNDAICKHVIPIDMQWLYYGIWDQVGSFIINYIFAQIFNSIDQYNGEVHPIFDSMLCFPKNYKYDVKIPNNKITNIYIKADWKPNNKLDFISPNYEQNENNTNYLATLYNLVGHSISMGIVPNYILKFNPDDNNKKYNELPGYLDWLKKDILQLWNNNNNFIKVNRLASKSEIKNLNLFAISANRNIFKSNGVWPLPSISPLHDITPDSIEDAIDSIPNILRIYSERNDTEYTWYYENNFDMEIFDSTNNTITTINKFLE